MATSSALKQAGPERLEKCSGEPDARCRMSSAPGVEISGGGGQLAEGPAWVCHSLLPRGACSCLDDVLRVRWKHRGSSLPRGRCGKAQGPGSCRERLSEVWAGRRDGTWKAPLELCRLLRLPRLGSLAQGCCSGLTPGVPRAAASDASEAAAAPAAAAALLDVASGAPGPQPSLAMLNNSGR